MSVAAEVSLALEFYTAFDSALALYGLIDRPQIVHAVRAVGWARSPTASGPYYSLHRCVVLEAAAAASPHETALPLPAANFDGCGHTTSQPAQPAFRVTTVELGRPLFLIYDTQSGDDVQVTMTSSDFVDQDAFLRSTPHHISVQTDTLRFQQIFFFCNGPTGRSTQFALPLDATQSQAVEEIGLFGIGGGMDRSGCRDATWKVGMLWFEDYGHRPGVLQDVSGCSSPAKNGGVPGQSDSDHQECSSWTLWISGRGKATLRTTVDDGVDIPQDNMEVDVYE
ncbi:hypothetical protein CNYM01_07409 [Colletotrichum nymphaeae SA-01]|uniref:Uncharacterized protein n=1 Tax=Colletotrichum nymphaeae SA-01 TaxID=1460502 RepID=A0A135TVQ7_9PEZI|nr:hypothetical protein CNYM01_07409 [Colletotrichum nymphaeae SA-01]